MITLTVQDALISMQPRGQRVAPLVRLANEPIPAVTAWTVADLVEALTKVVERYDNRRLAALERHGELDEEAGRYTFSDPKAEEAYQAEMKDLLGIELTYDVQRLARSTVAHAQLAATDVAALAWLFEEARGLPDPPDALEERK